MANITIDDLVATPIASVTGSHWLAIDDGVTTTKLAALDLTIQTITTLGAGASVAKEYSLGTLVQRGIVAGTNALTVAESANDVTLSVVPGNIDISNLGGTLDLSTTNNDIGFLTTVNLTTDVTGILPVSNGGTGLGTLPDNSVLVGNGTSAIQAILMTTPNSIVVGTPTGPEAYTVVGGTSIDIVNDTVANTLTWNFVKGNFVEDGDSPTFVNLTVSNIEVQTLATIQDICIQGEFGIETQEVTQTGSMSAGVTLNASAGKVTLYSDPAGILADTHTEFFLANSYVEADSIVLVTLETQDNIASSTGIHCGIGRPVTGGVVITITHTGNQNAPVATRKIHFVVITNCTP